MDVKPEIKITQVDWFDDRFYRFDLSKDEVRYIASVTTRLGIERKWALEQWRGLVGNQQADFKMYEASERGKRIHWAWGIYLNGGTILYQNYQAPIYTEEQIETIKKETLGNYFILKNQDEMNQLYKLQRFYETVKPKVLHTELTVYDLEGTGIAGTLDDAFYIEKGTYFVSGSKGLVIPVSGIYIADLKSGNFIDDAVWNQISPYAYCYEKMGYGEVVGGLCIHTGASTKGGIPGLAVKLRTREEMAKDFSIYKMIASLWDERNPDAGPQIKQFPSLIKRFDL